MRSALFSIFLAVCLFPAISAAQKQEIIEENKLLEAELKFAQKPDIYFVFNLPAKEIRIKSRGMVLRSLPVVKASFFGTRTADRMHVLSKKRTFIKPGREKIKPGDNKENDSFDIDALELDDMPLRYKLVTDNGVTIYVKPKTDGILSALCNVPYSMKNSLTVPLHAFFRFVMRKPYTAVTIVLEPKDAQALYWSAAEKSGIVIYPPSGR